MVRTPSLIAAVAAAAMVSACDTPNASMASMSSQTYNETLGSGYVELSTAERAEYDWRDNRHFAQKAIDAGENMPVEPDTVESRNIPAEYQEELGAARVRLVSAYGQGAREAAPVEVATAQVMYDCWLQEREENHQDFDIGQCQSGYENAMAEVDAIMLGETGPFNVFFDFGAASLTDDAQSLLDSIMADLTKRPDAKIVVSGHTDTVGSDAFNFALSEQRAEAVAAFLAANGVPEDAISLSAYGQNNLLVPTGDGVKNAQNRRAAISVQ